MKRFLSGSTVGSVSGVSEAMPWYAFLCGAVVLLYSRGELSIQFPSCLPCVSRLIAIITPSGVLLTSFLLLPHLLITFIFGLKVWNILRTISHHNTSTPFFGCHISKNITETRNGSLPKTLPIPHLILVVGQPRSQMLGPVPTPLL